MPNINHEQRIKAMLIHIIHIIKYAISIPPTSKFSVIKNLILEVASCYDEFVEMACNMHRKRPEVLGADQISEAANKFLEKKCEDLLNSITYYDIKVIMSIDIEEYGYSYSDSFGCSGDDVDDSIIITNSIISQKWSWLCEKLMNHSKFFAKKRYVNKVFFAIFDKLKEASSKITNPNLKKLLNKLYIEISLELNNFDDFNLLDNSLRTNHFSFSNLVFEQYFMPEAHCSPPEIRYFMAMYLLWKSIIEFVTRTIHRQDEWIEFIAQCKNYCKINRGIFHTTYAESIITELLTELEIHMDNMKRFKMCQCGWTLGMDEYKCSRCGRRYSSVFKSIFRRNSIDEIDIRIGR